MGNFTMDKLNALVIQKDIKNYIKQLQKKELYFFGVPEELRLNSSIVAIERELGIRKTIKKGFNIINNTFFVEEIVLHKEWNDEIVEKTITTFFSCFETYFEFLQGDIYENACYYKYNFTQEEIDKYSIDILKINFRSFIQYDIDNFTLAFSENEILQYNEAEKRKINLKKWLVKFNNCQTYEEFKQVYSNLKKSAFSNNLNFFLFNFIYGNNENVFNIITQFLNDNNIFNFEKVLCLKFNSYEVLNAYDNSKFYLSATAKKWKDRLKFFIEELENKEIAFTTIIYFDKDLHFFVCREIGKPKNYQSINGYIPTLVDAYRYFETFDELAKFLDYDLSNCDLSQAILPDLELSKYKINEQTKLPINFEKNFTYNVTKIFDRFKNHFLVKQIWLNEFGKIIKEYNHTFNYFCDYVHFLKNDLSDADLLFCDGLSNVIDFSDLNLTNAKLKSNILDKLGVRYELISNTVESFGQTKANELETVNALIAEREQLSFEETLKCQKIYYITDLHLLHRLHNANCKSYYDKFYVFQKIIDSLLNSVHSWEKNIILIGGDTSSDFAFFELFVKQLRTSIDERKLDVQVIFTLGNHELWDFVGDKFNEFGGSNFDNTKRITFDEIVDKYRKVITENKMYLLQNNLIFKYDWNSIEEISAEEIKNLSQTQLLNRLKKARLILFGGLGFAGCNNEFNANQLIYRLAINRQQEIEESKKFEELYEKICADLSDKRVIIFTHMPQKDWCSSNMQVKGFIYVNGHTHRNYFYDDGDYRLYSDNQVGYYQERCKLKYFYLEDDYDLFATYENGIYEISREDYVDFYIGKNINMDFFRDFDKLYMLKKNGYYLFILQSANGNLNILNGGAIKRLANNTVHYYYENMDRVISYIKTPLDNFSDYQKQISDEIKAIGGSGNIHGAIIDIDFFNHIYVNPIDLSVTAYWASDIVNKIIFEDTPTLLKCKCPQLYANYLKQIESKSKTALVLNKSSIVRPPQFYLDTDIYRASREIKKMQKLSSNILSLWVEPENKKIEQWQ